MMKTLITCIGLCMTLQLFSQALSLYDLTINYKENPIGIDQKTPRFSWKIKNDREKNNILQKAYHIQVVTDTNQTTLHWDSKKTQSEQSVHVAYRGEQLSSKTRYFWRVKIWDNHERESQWSDFQYFETSFFDTSEWKAKWIVPLLEEGINTDNPSPYLRKEFTLSREVEQARLYITAHGLYKASLNGQDVTDDVFTPGWTSYHNRLQYQVYDVTSLLQSGKNTAGVILGDGWFRGRLGWQKRENMHGKRNIYGAKTALLYQLEITYADGSTKTILSDKNWKASHGPIRFSSIYDGELYDANKELKGWDMNGFNDKRWSDVAEAEYSLSRLIPQEGVPVRALDSLDVKEILSTPKGELVIDFGQLITGAVAFELEGKPGDTITISHAEVLDQEGNFYTENLRSAEQIVRYVFSDKPKARYTPYFSFQGFRYIRIAGYEGTIQPENFTALAIYSDMASNGHFECSDSLVNQLQSNIRWGQKGNFLDIPTDCPQRDERLGWTGDAQVFASTAIFNFNTALFFKKWLADLEADQEKNGAVPFVVPDILYEGGAIGWGDAATIIPYELYLKYGDIRFLEAQYESMKSWVGYMESLAGENHLIDSGFHFGDWLFFIHPTDWNVKPGYTDLDLITTAFYAYSTQLVKKAAILLGKENDVAYYTKLLSHIQTAFQHEFLTTSGRLSSNSQTAYALALKFDLIPEELKEQSVFYLVDNIKKRQYHLSTGFLGTPYLCEVLTENGHLDVAYKLLLQTKYPSWLYPVTKGATTIWERWDGIKPDGSFQTPIMNSFNHYAYGAIGNWLYAYVAGIQTKETTPGYKHILIKPHVDTSLTMAKASYESMYGEISSRWKIVDNEISLEIVIPVNTHATITLPFTNETIRTGSGVYQYTYAF